MRSLDIDGSAGDGGGQILRSSLTLAALTGDRVRVRNIRARREKPGLLRQHLAASRAVASVCGGKLEGDELGSRELAFTPGPVRAGVYEFAVGSAGSASLVCQTVLPVLLRAAGASELTFHGGTHNPGAPPYDYLEHVYFPILRRAGVQLDTTLLRVGFYPAGGGCFRVRLTPAPLSPLELVERDPTFRIEAWTIAAGLPPHVVARELSVVRERLELPRHLARPRSVESNGPGNVVCVLLDGKVPELVTAFGAPGKPAELVAEDAVHQARGHLAASAPVGEHLADQLLIVLVLTGGVYCARALSSHACANVGVVRAFFGEGSVQIEQHSTGVRVRCSRAVGRR